MRSAALLLSCVAILLTACAKDPEPLTHGTVALEFHRGESQADNPFLGTATVQVTMEYLECLSAFYDANPSMRQEGPDGAEVFGSKELGGEGWTDRLCHDKRTDQQAKCSILEIDQKLEVVKQLTITYQLEQDNLEGARLLFGPIPTDETAECEAGLDARMRIGVNGAKGKDGSDNTIWDTEAASPNEVITDQGAPIRIAAARQ
jgi:hypothetical protein